MSDEPKILITDLENQISQLKRELKNAKKKPTDGTELAYQGEIQTLREETSELHKRLRSAARRQGILKILVDEMETIVSPLEPLDSQVARPKKSQTEEHFVMHLSDEHADEVVELHQTSGLEYFDFNTALCRAENYIDSLLGFKNDLPNHTFPVLHVLSYGDHTSGEIHGAKERSHYRNQFRNSFAIGQMQALMLRELAPHFKQMYVYCVPGNHGRRSVKKDFHGAHDNWDYMISEVARMHVRDIPNIEFFIPDSYSMHININGWGFGLEHGDGVKSWNSIPFYGLERKTRRMVALHNSFDRKISYFVFGHFHMSSSMADLKGETIINGAWPATNAYGFENYAGYREPMQLIHGVHERRGMSWRLPIKLKDPDREKEGPRRYKIDLIDETKTP